MSSLYGYPTTLAWTLSSVITTAAPFSRWSWPGTRSVCPHNSDGLIWWWAIVFRFPVVARLLLWAVRSGSVLSDARNDRVARCIARHIHVSLFDAHWKDVVQHISTAACQTNSCPRC